MIMYEDLIKLQGDLKNNNMEYAISYVINTSGSSIAKPGFKLLISDNKILHGTLGSPSLDNVALKESMLAIKNRKTKTLKIALDKDNKNSDYSMNTTCGGIIELYIEPYYSDRLVLVAESENDELMKAMVNMENYTGLKVIKYNIKTDKDTIFNDSFDNDYILMLTKSPAETEFLSYFLTKKSKYLGLVASKNRFNSDLDTLRKKFSEDELKRIKCPAGMDINAITIGEIAISIISEIISIKNKN